MDRHVDTDAVMNCSGCGASIYQEHIDRGLAGMWAGEMLCPTCLKRRKGSSSSPGGERLDTMPLQPDESSTTQETDRFSAAEAARHPEQAYRPGGAGPGGARHVRIFHAKLSDGAIGHLDEQINTWLNSHPEISIQFACTTVGVWEAKHAEPNLIITLFY